MIRSIFLAGVIGVSSLAAFGQTDPKTTKFPAGVPVKETGVEANGGKVTDRTYSNSRFEFEITIPESWFIGGVDFEKVLKQNGHDLTVDTAAAHSKRDIDVLMTAFRSEPGRPGAVLRLTSESLKTNPQIRDAVDYFDAITAAYSTAKLPAGFSYSSTKAEKLGSHQFAYLDTTSSAGRKRMYATVRKGFAIMFTLSYSDEQDVQTLRNILAAGKFPKK